MRHDLLIHLLPLVCWITLAGCATHLSPPAAQGEKAMPAVAKTFHSLDLGHCQPEPVKAGMERRVEHFLMILDPSASMTEAYSPSQQCAACHQDFGDPTQASRHAEAHRGDAAPPAGAETTPQGCTACHHDFLFTKFNFAKEISRCFNQTIPVLDFSGSLRTFGSPVYTATTYGPLPYDKSQFDLALQKVVDVDGASPLDQTLLNAAKDWFAAEGRMGVLVISDGKGMGENEVLAAKELVGRYGDRVCLYTVQIGDDAAGAEVLREISRAGQCGAAVNGDTLLEPNTMGEFVRQVFLQAATGSADTDGDGVADDQDACPDTKPGRPVDAQGCWQLLALADLLFEFDRYTLKPEGMAILDQVVTHLQENPGLRLAISGHTDNVGTRPYNDELSRQRAEAGLAYLVKKGIARERIDLSWHGFTKPKESNEAAAGRARNRRIEFSFSMPGK